MADFKGVIDLCAESSDDEEQAAALTARLDAEEASLALAQRLQAEEDARGPAPAEAPEEALAEAPPEVSEAPAQAKAPQKSVAAPEPRAEDAAPPAKRQKTAAATERLSVMTWNVMSLNTKGNAVVELLQTRSPDILFVQEAKLDTKQQPEAKVRSAFEAAGYALFYNKPAEGADKKTDCAVAVRRAGPLAGGRLWPRFDWDEQSRVAVFEANGHLYVGVLLPTPTGAHAALRATLDQALRVELASHGDRVAVVAGDCNVTLERNDARNGAIFGSGAYPATRDRFRTLLRDVGLVDSFRAKHPDAAQFTSFQADRQNVPDGRVDYVLLRRDVSDDATVEIIYGEENPRDSLKKRPTPARTIFKGSESSFDHVPVIASLRAP